MYQLSASIPITDSLEVENIKKDEMTAMTTGTTTNETSEAENNTESYSIAGTYLILFGFHNWAKSYLKLHFNFLVAGSSGYLSGVAVRVVA